MDMICKWNNIMIRTSLMVIGSGTSGIPLLMMIIFMDHSLMIITIEDIGWNWGFHNALTLFPNVSSSSLQWIVNYSKYLTSNQINMHKIKWGKGIQTFLLEGSDKI